MFWPSMIVFAILAIAPFVVATLMNRRGGDSLSDVEDLGPEVAADAPGSGSGTGTGEEV